MLKRPGPCWMLIHLSRLGAPFRTPSEVLGDRLHGVNDGLPADIPNWATRLLSRDAEVLGLEHRLRSLDACAAGEAGAPLGEASCGSRSITGVSVGLLGKNLNLSAVGGGSLLRCSRGLVGGHCCRNGRRSRNSFEATRRLALESDVDPMSYLSLSWQQHTVEAIRSVEALAEELVGVLERSTCR